MDRHLIVSVALAALALLSLPGAAGTALADAEHHVPAPLLDLSAPEGHLRDHPVAPAAPTGMPTAIVPLVGLALLAGVGLHRLRACPVRGRVIACALALAVSVFTVETAVHSVHHVGDPGAGATCPVLSGSQHLPWAEAPASVADTAPFSLAAAPFVRIDDVRQWEIYRARQERAPPA